MNGGFFSRISFDVTTGLKQEVKSTRKITAAVSRWQSGTIIGFVMVFLALLRIGDGSSLNAAAPTEYQLKYAVQRTENTETRLRLTNSPVHLAKFNGVVPLMADKLFLGLEEQFTSGRKTLAGNQIGGFWVTNVTLFNQNLFKGLDLSASIYNLFGKKYSDPGAGEHVQDKIQQDGRSFRFKLTYRF